LRIVDPSGWIEYLANGANADFFAPVIRDRESLIVPTVCILEVMRYVTRTENRQTAQEVRQQMEHCVVADLTAPLADLAARLSLKHNLPLADAIIYATAQWNQATLYTQDDDFEKLPGVKFVRKR
jgi:toxin FitB